MMKTFGDRKIDSNTCFADYSIVPGEEKKERKEKEDPYLTSRIDVDVVFGVRGMRNEWFHQELPQHALNRFHLLCLAGLALNPCPCFRPSFVQGQQSTLSSSLDQLVGLRNEFGPTDEEPWVGGFRLIQDGRNGSIFGEVEGGQPRGWIVSCGCWQRGRLDNRRSC